MVLLASHEWPPETDAPGSAPVAVLVHGIAGWWRTWWRVGPALAGAGWRVIAVDLRGHGGSPPIEAQVLREDLALDLAETIEALEIAPVDVAIGHSLGAAVVQELAHAQPELVRRVVLEDPPGTDRSGDPSYADRLAGEVSAALEDPERQVEALLAANPAWLPEDARQTVEGQQRCDIDGIVASLREGMGSRVVELVPILTVPALYLLATEERSSIWGAQRAALLGGVPSGSSAIEIESGHVIHRDRFDDYLALLTGWLAETARG